MGLNLSSIFGTTKPNQMNPTQFQDMIGKYGFIDKATYDKYKILPEFASAQVKPVGNGMAAIDKSIMDSLTNNYMALDKTKLGQDLVSKALSSRGYGIDDAFYVKKSDFDYYNNFANSAKNSKMGYYGLNSIADPFQNANVSETFKNYPGMYMNVDGKKMAYIPYEAGAKITRDKDTDSIVYLTDALGNEDMFKYGKAVNFSGSTLDQIKNSIAQSSRTNLRGADYGYETPGLGYLFSPEDYDKYIYNKMSKNASDFGYTGANEQINTGHGVHDLSGLENQWLVRNYDPNTGQSLNLLKDLDKLPIPQHQVEMGALGISRIFGRQSQQQTANSPVDSLQASKWFTQSGADPRVFAYQNPNGQWGQLAYDQWVEKKGGGGFFGGLSEIVSPVMSVLSVLPTPIQPIAAAYTAANSLTSGVMNGNPLQIATGALGAYGAMNPGSNIAASAGNSINNGLNLGLSQSAAQALGQGALGTGLGLLGGQDLGKALQNGLASGLTGLAGGQLSQLFGQSGLPPALSQALTSGGTAALSNLLRGNSSNFGTSALAGLFSGGVGSALNTAGMNPQMSRNLGKLITTIALAKRAKRRG